MKPSKITWFVKDKNEEYVAKEEYNAGTYRKDEKIAIDLQVWNNRWGVESVSDLETPVINFYFDTFEDSSLLPLCKLILNDEDEVALIVKNGKATAVIDTILSGKANNGDEGLENNKENFIDIRFEFATQGQRLKTNDLKKMYFEIVPLI